jgi:hypothetical protein
VDVVAVLAVGVGRDIVAVAADFRVAAGAGLGALRPIILAPLTNLPRAGGALAKGCTVAELLLTIAAGLEEALRTRNAVILLTPLTESRSLVIDDALVAGREALGAARGRGAGTSTALEAIAILSCFLTKCAHEPTFVAKLQGVAYCRVSMAASADVVVTHPTD